MKKVQELTGDELLDELGVELDAPKAGGYTPRQERIIAGFEDVLRFYETNGHIPEHGQHRDIFERLYAVRLDQLRKLPEADLEILRPMDAPGLLAMQLPKAEGLEDDELLSELGGLAEKSGDIATLRHVKSDEARREAAEQIADRFPCKDFAKFKPMFDQTQADLNAGAREAKRFIKDASIEEGDFFIYNGQLAYVAEVGEEIRTSIDARPDARLRVIYSNGTESNLLLRSLQRGLYKDENGRRLTQPNLGPLFADTIEPDDMPSGTIYVLRSLSTQPEIVAIRDVLHKIGVTGGRVEDRICNAEKDATYLLAPVEIVATWKLANIHRFKFEQTIHRVFGAAQLQLKLQDRFGNAVEPREWFVVPLNVIDEAMRRFQDGSITEVVYDSNTASLKNI